MYEMSKEYLEEKFPYKKSKSISPEGYEFAYNIELDNGEERIELSKLNKNDYLIIAEAYNSEDNKMSNNFKGLYIKK